MKKLITIAAIIFSTAANAGSAIILDGQGRYAGSATRSGQNIMINGAQGQYLGSVMPSGNHAVVLDSQGGAAGYIMPPAGIPALPPLQ